MIVRTDDVIVLLISDLCSSLVREENPSKSFDWQKNVSALGRVCFVVAARMDYGYDDKLYSI